MSYQSDGYGNGYGYNYNNNRNKQKKQKPHTVNQNILDQLDAMLEESVKSVGNKSATTNDSHAFSTGSGEESGPPPKPRFVQSSGVVKKDKVQQKIDRVRPVGSAMMVNQEPSASGQVYMDKAKEKAARYDAGNMKMQTSTVNSDKVNAAPVAVVAQATVVSAGASVMSGGSSGSGGSSSASGPPPLPKYVSSNDSMNSKYPQQKSQAYTHKTQASAYAAYTSTVTPSVTRPVLSSVVEETKHDYHYQASESEPMQVPQSSAPPLPTMAYNTANDKFQRKIANARVAARQYAEGDYVTANTVLGMNSADGEGTSKEKWESQNAKNSKGRRSKQYKAKNNEAYAPYEASTIAGSLPMQSNQAPIPVAVVVQPDSNSQYQSNFDDMSSMSPPYPPTAPPTYEEPVVQTQMQMKPEDEIDLTAAFLKSTKMITKVTEEISDGRKSVTTTTVHKRRDGRVIKTIEEEKELDEVGKHGTTVVQPVQVAGCCIVS